MKKWFPGLDDCHRKPGLDYLRGMAIISVVAFHYHYLPYGYLGVDLFFVLSGFLVGGALIDRLTANAPLNIFKFYVSRFTKILPSYLFFICLGGTASFFLYRYSNPGSVLHLGDLGKYILFTQNYSAQGSLIFAHIWSLCVEEHFYLLLPAALLVMTGLGIRSKKLVRLTFVVSILAINVFRYWLGYYGHETMVTTHSRIDSMLWGMLAFLAVRDQMPSRSKKALYSVLALTSLAALIIFDTQTNSLFFTHTVLPGLTPIVSYLFIVAFADLSLPGLQWLRVVSYHSYNFYLWHMLSYFFVLRYFGRSIAGLAIFMSVGFLSAMAATRWIEHPGLMLRKHLLNWFTRRSHRKISAQVLLSPE